MRRPATRRIRNRASAGTQFCFVQGRRMTDEELDEAEKQINEIRRNWLFHLFKKRLSGRSTTVAAEEGELEPSRVAHGGRYVEPAGPLQDSGREARSVSDDRRSAPSRRFADGFRRSSRRVRRDRQNGSRGDRSERPARARSGDPVDQGVSEVGRFRSVRRADGRKMPRAGLPVSAWRSVSPGPLAQRQIPADGTEGRGSRFSARADRIWPAKRNKQGG